MKKFRKFITMSLAILMVMAVMPFAAMPAFAEGEQQIVSGRIRIFDSVTDKRITTAGAVFDILSGDSPRDVQTVTTDATGTTSLANVVVGETYTVKMKTPPAGYAMSNESYQMKVTESGLATIGKTTYFTHEIKCAPIYGQVTQKNSSGSVIKEAGAIYCIYDKNGKLFDTMTTDANGVAKTRKVLPYGSYTVAQKKPSIGYFLDSAKRSFTVSESSVLKQSDGSYLFNFDYKNETLNAKLVLRDGNSELHVRNAKFELYDANENKLEDLVTDNKGVAEIKTKLAYGHYVIKTISDPSGFISTVNEFDVREELFEKQADGTMAFLFKIPEKHIKGKLNMTVSGKAFTKVEESQVDGFTVSAPVFEEADIEGFEYEINAQEDIVINGWKKVKAEKAEEYIVGDEDSKEKEFFLGKYWVVEKEIEKEYISQPEQKELVFEQNGRRATVKVDMPLTYEHKMTKVELNVEAEFMSIAENEGAVNCEYTMKGTDGYKFGLYTNQAFTMVNTDKKDKEVRTLPADSLVAIADADAEGHVVFSAMLPLGKYYVKQIAGAEGYLPNEYRFDFDTSDGAANEAGVIEVKASESSKNILVKAAALVKSMADDKSLEGTKVEVVDAEDKVVFSGTTDAEGKTAEFTLIPGEYAAREVSATEGYEWNDEKVPFVMNAEGAAEEPAIAHEAAKYVMMSVDENGNPQKGAEFTLYLNDEGIANAVADENGLVEFDNLKFGKYIIKETVAVDGYRRNPERHEFEIGADWKNEKNYDADNKAANIFHNQTATVFSDIGETVEDMSSGAKIGAGVGIAAGVAAIAALVVVLVKKKKSGKKAA